MNSGFPLPQNHTSAKRALTAPLRVIHFVADDSIAVQHATFELMRTAKDTGLLTPMLVLDKPLNASIANTHLRNIPFTQLGSWSSVGRAYEFYRLCREFQPDAVFIHSQHLNSWCRYASLRAGVAHIFESHDHQIPYGITLQHFVKADEVPLAQRIPGIIMPSGFSDQFDLQLIRALACLREKRLYPRIFLTGSGSHREQLAAQKLGNALGLDKQIRIAHHCSNLPFLLMHHQLAVVGNPAQHQTLVAQVMAAGCALVGITHDSTPTIINDGKDGVLLAEDSPELLAEKLEELLQNTTNAQQLAHTARVRAISEFSLGSMQENYLTLYQTLAAPVAITHKVA